MHGPHRVSNNTSVPVRTWRRYICVARTPSSVVGSQSRAYFVARYRLLTCARPPKTHKNCQRDRQAPRHLISAPTSRPPRLRLCHRLGHRGLTQICCGWTYLCAPRAPHHHALARRWTFWRDHRAQWRRVAARPPRSPRSVPGRLWWRTGMVDRSRAATDPSGELNAERAQRIIRGRLSFGHMRGSSCVACPRKLANRRWRA